MDNLVDLGEIPSPLLIAGGPVSNFAATKALQQRVEELGIPAQQIICTGDIVAYGADAAETSDLIQSWGIHVARGNCEVSLANSSQDCGCGFEEGTACNIMAKGWYANALAQTRLEQAQWMGTLPPFIGGSIAGKSFVALHGAVTRDNRFLFASSPDDEFREELAALAEIGPLPDIIIAGHSGIPFHREIDGVHWINAGSLGLPANDGTADTWYCLLEAGQDRLTVSWQRLPYDWRKSQHSMREAGLCEGYDRCLETGLWPSLDVLPEVERAATGMRLELADLQIALG